MEYSFHHSLPPPPRGERGRSDQSEFGLDISLNSESLFPPFSSKGGSSPGVRGAGHATSGSRHHRVIEGTRRTINNSKRRILSLNDDDSINMINHIYHQDVSTKLRLGLYIIMKTILYCFWSQIIKIFSPDMENCAPTCILFSQGKK